jgi:hypothetical protein
MDLAERGALVEDRSSGAGGRGIDVRPGRDQLG